ncbi:MAG: NAD(P)-dependent oxidoreductase [Bacteroidota bacterium]
MKKLLVTGISGFLGQHLARLYSPHWQLLGTYHKHQPSSSAMDCFQLDISDSTASRALLDKLHPDAILHLAACAQPNFCEEHPDLSEKVNVQASVHLAKLAAERDIPFVFTSTDLVFDGASAPYAEEDATGPVNLYGQQKARAEQQILGVHSRATVARMPLMYSTDESIPSFLIHWLKALREGREVYAFTDEIRTALHARDAVEGLLALLELGASGIWHLGGDQPMSRYDFIVHHAQEESLPTELIRPSLQKDVSMPAARPANVSLDSQKARNAFGWLAKE